MWGAARIRQRSPTISPPTASPLAKDALKRIGRLYDIEHEITGQPSERRREARQNRSLADDFARINDQIVIRLDELLPWN